MKDLVFIEPVNKKMEPYTTDEIIAECAEVGRKTIQNLIRKHKKDLEIFSLLRFENAAVKEDGGRGIKHRKVYHLNEQQATFCGADALTKGDYCQTRSNYCPNCGARMDGEESK